MANDEHLEWFPFYPGRFLTDLLVVTGDLDAVGALVKLRAHQWIHGALPEDLAKMARLLAVTPERMGDIWDDIGERFTLTDDGWVDGDLEELRQEQLEKRDQRRAAGRKGARKRWGDSGASSSASSSASSKGTGGANGDATSSAEEEQSDGSNTRVSLSLSLEGEDDDEGVGLDEEFDAWWEEYPARKGNNPKGEAFKAYRARRQEGVEASDLLEGVKRYAAQREEEGEVGTPFVMRATTFLRSAEGWKQEWTLTGANGRKRDNGRSDDPGLDATTEARKGWSR